MKPQGFHSEDEEILSCEDIDKKFKEGKLCFRAVE